MNQAHLNRHVQLELIVRYVMHICRQRGTQSVIPLQRTNQTLRVLTMVAMTRLFIVQSAVRNYQEATFLFHAPVIKMKTTMAFVMYAEIKMKRLMIYLIWNRQKTLLSILEAI